MLVSPSYQDVTTIYYLFISTVGWIYPIPGWELRIEEATSIHGHLLPVHLKGSWEFSKTLVWESERVVVTTAHSHMLPSCLTIIYNNMYQSSLYIHICQEVSSYIWSTQCIGRSTSSATLHNPSKSTTINISSAMSSYLPENQDMLHTTIYYQFISSVGGNSPTPSWEPGLVGILQKQ